MVKRHLFTYREADWLRSPIFWIPHFTAHCFHLQASRLISNLGLLIILLPYISTVMSSRRIIISFTLGGCLSSKLCCAVGRFTNPIARLATTEIDLKLDSIARQQPSYVSKKQVKQDSKYWEEVNKTIVGLKRPTVEMVSKDQNADLHTIQADYDIAPQKLLAMEEKNNICRYVMPTYGSSQSISCLNKSARISKHHLGKLMLSNLLQTRLLALLGPNRYHDSYSDPV